MKINNKTIIILSLMILMLPLVNALPFSATWDTTKGGSASNTIILPIQGEYFVDWGDGLSNTSVATHIYASSGIYTINITNINITSFRFNDGGDKLKIINIFQWGDLHLGNSGGYFYGCENLNFIGTDNLNLTGTTDLSSMFKYDINFNGNISGWNTSSIIDMGEMFTDAFYFNQNLNNWDTGKVTNMNKMFYGNSNFNQPLNNWNTSSVTNMQEMFSYTDSFNKEINTWDTSSVTNMNSMFSRASAFNQPLNDWKTNNVNDMSFMFYFASAFNQNLSNWNVSNVTTMNNMFYHVTLSYQNYDALLNSWASQPVKSSITFNGGYSKYSLNALTSRNYLTDNKSWTITDGGLKMYISSLFLISETPNQNLTLINSTGISYNQTPTFITTTNSESSLCVINNTINCTKINTTTWECVQPILSKLNKHNISINCSITGEYDTITREIYITNHVPVVDSVSIIGTDENLTFSNTTTDLDNDTITDWSIIWYNNSIQVPALDNQSIVNSSYLTLNDNWIVSLSAFDGYNSSLYVNSSVSTIGDNVSPILSGAELSASSGVNDAQFTIYVNISEINSLSSVLVTVVDTNGLATNYSMSYVNGTTTKLYSRTYTPGTDGDYNITWVYATDGNSNVATPINLGLSYTESTYTAPVVVSGGSSGGSSTSAKKVCDIRIIPETIEIIGANNVFTLIILNNDTTESFIPNPILPIELSEVAYTIPQPTIYSGGRTGEINFVNKDMFLNSEGNIVLSSTNCQDITIPYVVRPKKTLSSVSLDVKSFMDKSLFDFLGLNIDNNVIASLGLLLGIVITFSNKKYNLGMKIFTTLVTIAITLFAFNYFIGGF